MPQDPLKMMRDALALNRSRRWAASAANAKSSDRALRPTEVLRYDNGNYVVRPLGGAEVRTNAVVTNGALDQAIADYPGGVIQLDNTTRKAIVDEEEPSRTSEAEMYASSIGGDVKAYREATRVRGDTSVLRRKYGKRFKAAVSYPPINVMRFGGILAVNKNIIVGRGSGNQEDRFFEITYSTDKAANWKFVSSILYPVVASAKGFFTAFPISNNHFLLCDVNRRVWKSDILTTWTQTYSIINDAAVSTFAINQENNVAIAALTPGVYSLGTDVPVTSTPIILRSTDEGSTWSIALESPMVTTIIEGEVNYRAEFGSTGQQSAIYFKANGIFVVFAYFRDDYDSPFTLSTYYSLDEGISWTRKNLQSLLDENISSLVGDIITFGTFGICSNADRIITYMRSNNSTVPDFLLISQNGIDWSFYNVPSGIFAVNTVIYHPKLERFILSGNIRLEDGTPKNCLVFSKDGITWDNPQVTNLPTNAYDLFSPYQDAT